MLNRRVDRASRSGLRSSRRLVRYGRDNSLSPRDRKFEKHILELRSTEVDGTTSFDVGSVK